MKVAIGTDLSGLILKDAVKRHLTEAGHEVLDLGQQDSESPEVYYSEAAENVAEAILSGKAERGILICHTGGGMNIVANKIRGIYALSCESPYTAKMASTVNGCNVLVMGQGIVAPAMGCDMADEFLNHSWNDGFPQWRIELSKRLTPKMIEVEEKNFK
ncbi:MAG: RpiB/LacA/LacB family sugar-phosphate isomerase [Oscillospiraceae bacterium]